MSQNNERIVSLLDEEKDPLPCRVITTVQLDGETFALLTPTLPWVNVLRSEASEEAGLSEVELSDFPKVKHLLNEVLGNWGLSVEVKGEEYVLVGDLPEELFEESDMLPIENEEGVTEDFFVLAEVEDNGGICLVVAPETPALFPVKLDGDKATTVSDEQLEKVQAHLEKALEVG